MVPFPPGISEYTTWAYCGIGSTVVIESTVMQMLPNIEELRSAARNNPAANYLKVFESRSGLDLAKGTITTVTEIKCTLIEITSQGATVQIEIKATINRTPTHELVTWVIPAQADSTPKPKRIWTSKTGDGFATVVDIPAARLKEVASSMEGEEVIHVAGRPLPCRWFEQTAVLEGDAFRDKSWVSESIPGGLARSEISFGNPPKHSTAMVVTSFEKK